MTEFEKMLNGEFYDPRDPELLQLYRRCRQLTGRFNMLRVEDMNKRKPLLLKLFAQIAEKVWIEPPFYCDYGANISIGSNTFINMNCVFMDSNRITIGKNVLIGPAVNIYTSSHPSSARERLVKDENGMRFNTHARPVFIGDNVWVGGNCTILPGVTIGDNVTIGAGSVVTKNIPDNVVAYGQPCVVHRDILD